MLAEEVALGAVGGLGAVAGGGEVGVDALELCGALGDLFLEVVRWSLEAGVADLDLVEHVVEAVGELSELVGGGLDGADGVILVGGDGAGGLGEVLDGVGDEPLEARGEEEGEGGGGEETPPRVTE